MGVGAGSWLCGMSVGFEIFDAEVRGVSQASHLDTIDLFTRVHWTHSQALAHAFKSGEELEEAEGTCTFPAALPRPGVAFPLGSR